MKHGEWKAGLTYLLVMGWLAFRVSQRAVSRCRCCENGQIGGTLSRLTVALPACGHGARLAPSRTAWLAERSKVKFVRTIIGVGPRSATARTLVDTALNFADAESPSRSAGRATMKREILINAGAARNARGDSGGREAR